MKTTAVRVGMTSLNLLLLSLVTWVAVKTSEPEARMSSVAPVAPHTPVEHTPPEWAPPAWFPLASSQLLTVLPALDAPAEEHATTPPRLRSRAAIIADLDRGEVLYERNADDPWPVASLTKMVSGLALASTSPDLDSERCITHEQWPTRPGARSKFDTGTCTSGWDLLGSALVASDNRGAMSMPAISELRYDEFIDRMATVSDDLGMASSQWTDPSGIEDDNMSTARDMLKAVVAVAAHPVLSIPATAQYWDVQTKRGPRRLNSTNRLVANPHFLTLAAKTGYTDTARYCFATVVQLDDGRRLAVAVLGAPTGAARWTEARKLIDWASSID